MIEDRQCAEPLGNDVSELALLNSDLNNINLVIVMLIVRGCRRCEATRTVGWRRRRNVCIPDGTRPELAGNGKCTVNTL